MVAWVTAKPKLMNRPIIIRLSRNKAMNDTKAIHPPAAVESRIRVVVVSTNSLKYDSVRLAQIRRTMEEICGKEKQSCSLNSRKALVNYVLLF